MVSMVLHDPLRRRRRHHHLRRREARALRDRARPGARPRIGDRAAPEPPNFEIGWKRTKEIAKARPKGWAIADFLEKLEGLMGRGRYGSAALLAKVAEVVAERAREEAEAMAARGEVEERRVTELRRVLKLIEMDVEMVRAAAKEDTIRDRIETARARCRQAILVALSL
uniref:Uncharacterized protein n=1 Tax=Ananas comosus var. bracteatus TaxID=296719 RepID=A0A6V7QE52_ANACO|nr:unnamed protein product [Ananas comosus var. bracteatus]